MSRSNRTNTITTTPDSPGPTLHCPVCERRLDYQQTIIGGVQPPERWDYLHCVSHGWFHYRHRTRRLTPMAAPSGLPTAASRMRRRHDDE